MNNIYKKLSVILMFLGMVGCFYTRINCANAVSGSVTGGYGVPSPIGGGGGGGGSSSRRPLAYGYRISIVDSNGNVVSGTHSMDYWSEWGKDEDNNIDYGYRILKNEPLKPNQGNITTFFGKANYSYYYVQKPKTVGSSDKRIATSYVAQYHTEEKLVSEKYENIVKENFEQDKFICKKGENPTVGFEKNKLISGGCGNGGDKRIGNNFTKYTLYVMNYLMSLEDKSQAIKAFGEILRDCGVPGTDNNSRIMNVNDNFLIVEPLVAILDTGTHLIYVGTVYDLKQMNFSIISDNYIYANFMYINPVVYNTKARAGLDGCNTNPNGSSDNLTSRGCAGAFTISIGDVAPSCEAQATTALKAYQSGGTKNAYDTAINNACNALTDGSKDTCKTVLKNYTNYGIRNADDITSCNFTCNGVAQKISDNKRGTTNVISEIYADLFNKLKNTIYSNILGDSSDQNKYKNGEVYNIFVYRENLNTNRTNLCGTSSCENLLKSIDKTDENKIKKLSNLFPDYALLKKDVYEALDKEPECKSLPPNCYAFTSGDCSSDSGNLVFSDYNEQQTSSVQHEACIRYGVAYYDSLKTNLQSSKNSRYSTIAGTGIFCSEKVEFTLPKEDSSIIKAGRVFQWGTNIQTTTNDGSDDDVKTFGTMTITQTCYTNDVKNKISTGKIFKWENNNNIDTKISIKYTDPTGKYETDENEYLLPILDSIQYDKNYMDSNGKITSQTDKFIISATYKFDYNIEFKWYSDKSDKYEAKNKLTFVDVNNNPNYVFIGYGLPTSFATSDGLYEENLDVIIKDIGTNGRFNKYVENILGQSNGYNYSCSFKIHNESFGNECCTKEGEIIPNAPAYCGKCEGDGEPKGLDVVFRTIDLMDNSTDEELDRAFPGMSGKGITENNSPRKMGSNWNEIYNDGADNGAEKIFNILSSSIYNKEPMYRINLNVSLIQDIRSFNRDMRDDGRDPYSYMGTDTGDGHAGYTFYKEDNDETSYAFSNFLEYLTKDCTTTNRDGEKTRCLVVNYDCVNANNKAKRSSCHQEWWNEE